MCAGGGGCLGLRPPRCNVVRGRRRGCCDGGSAGPSSGEKPPAVRGRESGECPCGPPCRAGTAKPSMTPAAVCPLRQGTTKGVARSEEHTSELQSLMRISYAVFCLKKKNKQNYKKIKGREYTVHIHQQSI